MSPQYQSSPRAEGRREGGLRGAPQRHLNSPPFSSGGHRRAARHLSLCRLCLCLFPLQHTPHRSLDMGTLSVGCRHSPRDGCKGGERGVGCGQCGKLSSYLARTHIVCKMPSRSPSTAAGGEVDGHAINRVMTARHGAAQSSSPPSASALRCCGGRCVRNDGHDSAE